MRRQLLFVTIAVLTILFGQALSAPAAHAHAAVTSTEPRVDSTVTEMPDRVIIRVIKKQATKMGDPLRVFDPDGRRVDAGDVVVSPDGTTISVGLRPEAGAAGRYYVAYQITSNDTHIIEDRFTFTFDDAGSGSAGAVGGAVASATGRSSGGARLRVIGPPAASVASAVILALALIALVIMIRRRRHRVAEQPQQLFRVVSTDEHRLGRIPPAHGAPAHPPAPRAGSRSAGMARGGHRARSAS